MSKVTPDLAKQLEQMGYVAWVKFHNEPNALEEVGMEELDYIAFNIGHSLGILKGLQIGLENPTP